MGWRLSNSQAGYGPQVNPAVYIPGASTVANTQSRRIYPQFGSVAGSFSVFNSRYNALQLNVEKRLSHGLSLLANYTWSHEMDNYPPIQPGTDPFNRNQDWGNSLENLPNVLHASVIWQIPHVAAHGFAGRLLNGWELTSILTWQNGFPFEILSGVDNSLSGVGLDRADFVGTDLHQAILGDRPHGQNVSQLFNTALFARNAVGTFGNTAKSILQGPGLFDTDLGLIKDTRISERAKVQFRAEFFNVFNNVNFANPTSTTVGTATYGKITSAGDPRILQLALKLSF
jgi:hypothetical protein